MLLERDAELGDVRRLLNQADRGAGEVLLVEGPPGIGKTRVLLAARQAGAEAGFEVLATRAGELERELAWGVVRGLFEPALRALSDTERRAALEGAARLALAVLGGGAQAAPVGAGDAVASALHGLHWLTVNLALRRPLLIAVDDVHWADIASWRWLAYMATRHRELPLAMVLTARPLEAAPHDSLLRAVRREARVVHLAPLSADAAAALTRAALGVHAEDRFCLACHEATGGNPFLLSQLLRELARQDVVPLAVNAHRVESIGAEAVSDDVSARLGRLSPTAQRMARAIAVLGSETRLSDAAALAGLDADDAASAASELADAELVVAELPLRFIHPLVRTAVYEAVPPVQRARSHARAAGLLGGADAPAERVAVHLVAVEPSGDGDVAARLREAAQAALEGGAPDSATTYLRRALAEPPPEPERATLLRLLGRAEVATSGPAGLGTLEAALEVSSDPAERAAVALELSRSARMWGDFRRAALALDRALAGLDPTSQLGARVEGELINVAACDAETTPWALERLSRYTAAGEAEELEDPGLLADLAVLAATACRPREVAASFARRALAAVPKGEWDPSVLVFVTNALVCAGELEEAKAAWDDAIEPIQASWSALALGFALAWRAMIVLRLGDVRDAEADARAALAIYQPWGSPIAGWFLADALIERGELDEAERLLEVEAQAQAGQGEGWSPGAIDWIPILHTRGRLRLAQGRPEDAVAALLEAGRRCVRIGHLTPAWVPWRSEAALALLHLGDADRARELVAEELELARATRVPHAIGRALWASGLVAGGETGLALLREAVDVLADAPALLSYTRALCELGARLRRDGRRKDAEAPLREALDLADRCGASALAGRAREELVAAGARPRRARTTGPDALTASELRVARMAAEGRTNREIAQALFITLRTVETHLGHAYQKLDIRSRRELPEALGEVRLGAS